MSLIGTCSVAEPPKLRQNRYLYEGAGGKLMTPIDEYLTKVEPAKRRELERIRALALAAVPTAQEAIVYGMPTLKYQGEPFLGFDAHKHHIGIYPYSGQVIEELTDQLHEYG